MQEPRPHLQHLINEGRGLLDSMRQATPTRAGQKTTVDVGTSILATFLEEPGLRSRTAKNIGLALVQSEAAKKVTQLEASARSWDGRARQFLNTVSAARSNLGPRGNSADLVGRFVSAQDAAKAQTRLGKAVRFLERLEGQPLVYNGEILEFLKQRAVQKTQDARAKAEIRLIDIPEMAPGFDHLKFPNRAALHARLGAFPEERQMIEGAMDALLGDGPDSRRQALASARNALESMAKGVTGSLLWKEAIGRAAGESTKKIFRDVYEFLSGRGSHAGKAPTRGETEFGIHQALSCILWLIGHRNLFATERGA